MSAYTNARTYIANQLATVPNIGQVFVHERLIIDPAKFLEAFVGTFSAQKQVRGWVVTLSEISSDHVVFGKETDTYTFTAYGVMGVQDSADSEETFYALLEDIFQIADQGAAVTGTPGEVVGSIHAGAAKNLGYRQFGSVFCHYAEINIEVEIDR